MKSILISGIQPTGKLHIGNYFGALKNFVDLQNSGKYQCYFFIADLHALTENPAPKDLNQNILNLTADFLASGLDPKKSVIFQQSRISVHSELMWILNTIAKIPELELMTQFKDKAKQFRQSVNLGLFNYPVLMAADVLLYNTKFVPVGNDQDQHLEITRTLARRFNKIFGKTFVEPKAIHTLTPRVMSLINPEKKMSKSQPESCVFIDDSPEQIKAKIKKAVTDSGSEIKYNRKDKPAISNLLEIYSSLSGKTINDLEKKFKGKNYSVFKNDLIGVVADYFADFRKNKSILIKNKSKLFSILKSGSQKASQRAEKKIIEVKKKIGLA
ncbi:tryptophan--tRNA ligase [Candidatus Wolfebacteria bacterium]|nr:tryptophan--tRNA ligase [Candidatus Wolfebacteria bacterium]